jgi:hypothetical protein
VTLYPERTAPGSALGTSFPASCLLFLAAPPDAESVASGAPPTSSKEVVLREWALDADAVRSGAAADHGLALSVPMRSVLNVARLIDTPRRLVLDPATGAAVQIPLLFVGLRFVGSMNPSGVHRIGAIRFSVSSSQEKRTEYNSGPSAHFDGPLAPTLIEASPDAGDDADEGSDKDMGGGEDAFFFASIPGSYRGSSPDVARRPSCRTLSSFGSAGRFGRDACAAAADGYRTSFRRDGCRGA